MGTLIVFYVLAAVIIVASVLAVASRRMLRAATWLLVVLVSTAGLYLLLNYHFLAVVQLSVYAGGILILFIFAILLTSSKGDRTERYDRQRVAAGIGVIVAGIAVTTWVTLKHTFIYGSPETLAGDAQIPMHTIGDALMSTGKWGYLLPFEALSILLLACMLGGILIARKR